MVRILGVMAALACAVAVAGCGGSDSDDSNNGSGGGAKGGDVAGMGKDLFKKNCGSCHTLEDAGTNGTFGPNLDSLGDTLTVESVRDQIERGGGGMPANIVQGDEADSVAEYVASVAGQ